jgi:outer membrane lipoprotein carrier protein
MPRLRVLVILFLLSATAQASAPTSLERFFNDVHTYSARFQQVVLDEGLNTLQESSGSLSIERPGKFRWDYDTPYQQQIVGDGSKVWVYDVELQQVTVRRMTGALGNTPALLLAGKAGLKRNFDVTDLGHQGKLDWVKMVPKIRDGGFEDIRIGFENGAIRSLELVDGFGQTTRITLSDANENKKIDPKRFSFVPPKGVDVISE